MKPLLVDTDVVSFAFRGASQYDLYRDVLTGHELFISLATLAELMRGTLAANWGERRRNMLAEFIRSRFAILNTNRETCVQWAALTDEAKRGATFWDARMHGGRRRRCPPVFPWSAITASTLLTSTG
ncbi:MAG: PIN domain-containing protein [Planctomycetaceae bacterium]